MAKTTAKKYPTDRGAIDRKWLLTQLPEAKYPNALLEVALHPYFSDTLCNFAYVTDDVLIDFVMGRDELTASEFFELLRGLSNYKNESADFMVNETLVYCRNEEQIQAAKKAVECVCKEYRHPALSLIRTLLEDDKVPQSAVDNAERFTGWAESWKRWDAIKNKEYRSQRLEQEDVQ